MAQVGNRSVIRFYLAFLLGCLVVLVTQLVKNLPAMLETWVQSLHWEGPPGEGKGYPLQYSGLENFMGCIVHGIAKSWTQLSDFHFQDRYFPLVTKGVPGGSTVKNLPAMQETWVQSSGWEDSPGEGNCYPLQYSYLGNPMDRGAWLVTVHRVV